MPPRLSVVVYAGAEPASLQPTCDSLAAQSRFDAMEVIVADGSTDDRFRRQVSTLSWVRHLARPGATMPAVKAAAIEAASGELVAFVDPVDRMRPGWAQAILESFDADPLLGAIGGAVELAGDSSATDRAAYLFEYGAFEPPVRDGPAAGDLPGNNVAYRRALLAGPCAALIARLGFNKPFVHRELRRAGCRLALSSRMAVEHATHYRFGEFARRRFHYGRCFGANRMRESPRRATLALTLAAPLIPALLVSRHLWRALRRPWARRTLHRIASPLAGICLCWGCGEWLGIWTGPGRSCAELR